MASCTSIPITCWWGACAASKGVLPGSIARVALALLALCGAGTALAEDETPALAGPGPLGFLQRLVGCAWYLGDSWQTFHWGVGERSLIGRAYSPGRDGEPLLVSDGLWFWHPGEQRVKGYFFAVPEMPVHFFDYTTRFEGDTMVNRLHSFGEMGGNYEEHWEFTGPDSYRWTLYATGGEGRRQIMDGTYRRHCDGAGLGQ